VRTIKFAGPLFCPLFTNPIPFGNSVDGILKDFALQAQSDILFSQCKETHKTFGKSFIKTAIGTKLLGKVLSKQP